MNRFKTIAFTYKNIGVEQIGNFHVEENDWSTRLSPLKTAFGIDELMYLSTCNRTEFLLVTPKKIDSQFLQAFFAKFNPDWTKKEISWAVKKAEVFEGAESVQHFFKVASSIDSMVVGEREIITQVRNTYEKCNRLGLTGDFLRLLTKRTIETAKKVYTQTEIAKKSVSVVSLAYRKLREFNVKSDARFIIIGAGQTNSSMAKFLKKHEFSNFTVFNRSLENAQKLTQELGGMAFELGQLHSYENGFDVLITCTSSGDHIIRKDLYKKLVGKDNDRKIVIDLAVPNDFDKSIVDDYDINLIAIDNLRSIAEQNLRERKKELVSCEAIIKNSLEEFKKTYRERIVERAMRTVPEKVKEIKNLAVTEVFAKDLQSLDEPSKEVLNKVLAYMEKKYISVPMKMAKEILLEETKQ
ncbi:MAG: glutamyl-tRNA reductase [Flavobacteriales bacterium]|nr:MAG: glutamyl-tRNA reductase [Flavobacteriales bacterium]